MSANTRPSEAALPEPHKRLADALSDLRTLVNLLPESVPLGCSDDALAQHFSDYSVEEDEGPYYSVDRAWVRVFQGPEAEQLSKITRGPYGASLVKQFFEHFATIPGIEEHNGLQVLALRVEQFNRLLTKRCVVI